MLAKQSAEATQNSTRYIESALQAVESGKLVADDAAEELVTALEDAKMSADKVSSIALAFKEQSEAVKQIDVGIEQIAHNVEQNAVTAKESSASSEELTNEAISLKKLIQQFELKK